MGAGAYIGGEETSMLESLEGRRGLRAYKRRSRRSKDCSASRRHRQRLSLASVPIILEKGGEYYRDFGVGKSPGALAFQLAGNTSKAAWSRRRLASPPTSSSKTTAAAGCRDVRCAPCSLAVRSARLQTDKLDRRRTSGVRQGRRHLRWRCGVVVFDDTVDMVAIARFAMEFCVIQLCEIAACPSVGARRSKR